MRQIILASGSPRRQELVAQMGIAFTVATSNFEEWLDDNRPVEEMAQELALGKAMDVAKRHREALVIGCDTIVTLDGRQLGKQPDIETARRLLREMSGQRVEVFSAVSLVCEEAGLQETGMARAAIVYGTYGDAEIDRFLASNEWQDKAGATSVQSPLTPPVDHIEGGYDTVLGLSTKLLAEMLGRQGVKAKPVHSELAGVA